MAVSHMTLLHDGTYAVAKLYGSLTLWKLIKWLHKKNTILNDKLKIPYRSSQ